MTYIQRLLFFFTGKVRSSPCEYKLSICATFKQEARFLKEWIDYHRLVGVEHFWLYNNESTDNYQEVLQPYIEKGIVELIDWPNLWPQTRFTFGCQVEAFENAIERSKTKTEWLALIDLDEFIMPKQGKSVPELLDKYFCKHVGVAVFWQMFGTSDVDFIAPGEYVIERLNRKLDPSHEDNKWAKSIVRPQYVSKFENSHFAFYKRNKKAVNTHGVSTTLANQAKNYTTALIQINHYWTRDIHHLTHIKWPRVLTRNERRFLKHKDLNSFMNAYNIYNKVKDTTIKKFIPDLKSSKNVTIQFGDS